MRTVSTTLHTSKKIVSASARLGGRTVRVVGKTAKRTKLPAATVKNAKLMKQKFRQIDKAIAKDKLKKGATNSGKYIVKPVKFTVKSVAKAAGKAADSLTDSINNDTVRFAKQSYNAARKVVSGAKRTVRTVKNTVKRTRKLVNSVKRSVKRVKRTAKMAKKAAKVVAKVAKAAVKIVGKVINLIASTAPWSLILIGIVAIVLLISYLGSNLYTMALGSQERVAGWALDKNDEATDIYPNIKELAQMVQNGCNNKFAKDLKDDISDFCVSVSNPQRIIDYTIGNSSATLFPATGSDSTINTSIDGHISNSSKHTSTEYSDFMAALVVLTERNNSGNSNFVLEKFTQSKIEMFIGGLNSNSCTYGSTFFVKTTSITSGNTCPGAACKTKKEPGCDCGGEDENGRKICNGHPYCDNDHEKMTVKFQTADKYYGKSISEIYNFNEDEATYYADVSDFIRTLLFEMSSISGGDSQ